MSRTLLTGFAALALIVMAWPADRAEAGPRGCPASVQLANLTVDVALGGPTGELGPGSADDRPNDAIRLSQQLKLQTPPSRLPRRVPPRQTFYIQTEDQQSFEKFAAGATLPDLNCIEIDCPGSFPPGTRCWQCIEDKTTPVDPFE